MTKSSTTFADVTQLEAELPFVRDDEQRIMLIDKIVSNYAYTKIERAKELLSNQWNLLKKTSSPKYELNFHLHTAFIENQFYNYPLSEHHFKKTLPLLEELGDLRLQAEVCIDYAGICINLDNLSQANKLLEQAAKYLKVYPDKLLNARLLAREGFINLHVDNIGRAIELLLEADKEINTINYPLTLKDYYFLSLIYSGLGNCYEHTNDLEKGVANYLKVLDICIEKGLKTRLSWYYLNVGKAYLGLNDIERAERYFRQTIQETEMVSPDAQAGAYANLGKCYFLREQYNEALKQYERAEELYKKNNNQDANLLNFSKIESWRAQLYAALNRRELTEQHFRKAYQYARRKDDLRELAEICKKIASFYASEGDYKNAYDYQVMYSAMKERNAENSNNRKVMELEVKYESEKRKQEAEMLRLQATSLQLKALRAQMNPHFMYNALNSIQNYITSSDTSSAAKYLAKFANLMRQSLEYSELEIISLEKEIRFLNDYLSINQKLRFKDKLEYKINVHPDIEEDILGVPTMIVQPYVENAIEHGLRTKETGLVKVDFSLKDDYTILCIIEDNGIGRAKARELQQRDEGYLNHRSMGTKITEDRLRILHNSKMNRFFVQIKDLKDEKTQLAKGTRVEILIPIVEMQNS